VSVERTYGHSPTSLSTSRKYVIGPTPPFSRRIRAVTEAEFAARTEHFIRVFVEGIEPPLMWAVNKEEADRFAECYQGDRDYFCVFSTVAGVTVALNLRAVQLLNIFREPRTLTPEPQDDPAGGWLDIRLRGQREALRSSAAKAAHVYYLISMLESPILSHDDTLLDYIDEDGEFVLLDAKQVLYVKTPTALFLEGRSEALAEEGEEDEAGPAEEQRELVAKRKRSRSPRSPRITCCCCGTIATS
jgi:hypothetical protein